LFVKRFRSFPKQNVIYAIVANCIRSTFISHRIDRYFEIHWEFDSIRKPHLALQLATHNVYHETVKQWSSLRGKITFGYYAVGALIVALSVFAFVELRLIKDRVDFGSKVSELFDTALEIRRFEKNYFLYHQAVDYQENLAYTATARGLLEHNAAEFSQLADAKRLDALRAGIDEYTALMAAYALARGHDKNDALAARIRRTGKEIVTIAEQIAASEQQYLQDSLDRHRRNLLISIAVLTALIFAVGRLLSSMVVRPLKEMEDSMEAVANGRLTKIDIAASDREIASLTGAFNHVLQELELRQKHLLRSEKLASLGTMLSGVAHELNNPLSNISTSCQILMEENEQADPGYRKELLEQIDEQTIRARNIVRSLLDFARDREFHKESLNVARLMEQTLRFLKGQIPRQVAVHVDIPADLDIEADRQRLQQVLINLVKNAAEALDNGGSIRISAARRHASDATALQSGTHVQQFGQCAGTGDVVDIEIRDNGHGIPPELLPRIFDPFFTTKEVGKGSGLGLFIVFEIVEQHGGCIVVDSLPGAGTAFFIRLPVTQTAPHG
jgi:two-component system, NtrC family, sensor kinase